MADNPDTCRGHSQILFSGDPISPVNTQETFKFFSILSKTQGPLLEAIILFAFLLMALNLYRDQHHTFGSDPRVLWIPVFFLSAQYGMMGGLTATFFATSLYTFLDLPPRGPHQDFYNYLSVVALYPFQWLSYAICIGGLRSLQLIKSNDMEARLNETIALATDIGSGLERAVREIERFEARIVAESITLDAVLHALSEITFQNKDDFIRSFCPFAMRVTGSKIISVYDCLEAAPLVRLCDENETGIHEAPKISAALGDILSQNKISLLRSDQDTTSSFLPQGTICAAPIRSIGSDRWEYVFLVEQLLPNQAISLACDRLSSSAALCEIFLEAVHKDNGIGE